jgi:hypothetical protein
VSAARLLEMGEAGENEDAGVGEGMRGDLDIGVHGHQEGEGPGNAGANSQSQLFTDAAHVLVADEILRAMYYKHVVPLLKLRPDETSMDPLDIKSRRASRMKGLCKAFWHGT